MYTTICVCMRDACICMYTLMHVCVCSLYYLNIHIKLDNLLSLPAKEVNLT